MSLDLFRQIISSSSDPASEIWKLVAAYIEETENRIIDAELKVNDLIKAIEPFVKGAEQIPDSFPDGRGFLIGEEHPDNPKKYNLLIAFVGDFRKAKEVFENYSKVKE